jgi:hypothetical protein
MGLADRDRADTCHDIALWQMAMADNPLAPIRCLQLCMLGEKICDLGLDSLSQHRLRAPCRRISVSWSSKAPG